MKLYTMYIKNVVSKIVGKINRAVHHFSRNVNNQPIDSNE
jgi:hypothetical protein